MKKVLFLTMAGALFFLGRHFYFKPDYVYGESLPSFEIELLDGTTLDRSALSGKVVLLEFWGSWCGPCRRQSPELVQLYKDFHDVAFEGLDGFEILSIGIETDRQRWLSAIEKDGKFWKWHHASLDRFQGEMAREFGVLEIPTKFLINEKGIIVGVNPKFEDIRTYLAERQKN